MGAAHQSATRRTNQLWDLAYPVLAGSPYMRRSGLPEREFRSKEALARRTGTPDPNVLDRVDPISKSYALQGSG